MDAIDSATKNGDGELINEWNLLRQSILKDNLVSQTTLEMLLDSEISKRPFQKRPNFREPIDKRNNVSYSSRMRAN